MSSTHITIQNHGVKWPFSETIRMTLNAQVNSIRKYMAYHNKWTPR